MTLAPASIETILNYLDPYLDTLQTGFPTSSRPNEPSLTKDQKRQKIEAALCKDPSIFLTKWGSVILYPRPSSESSVTSALREIHANGDSAAVTETAKGILDLFSPLAADYEVNYHLTRLYQQLQQLSEHATFEVSSRHQHQHPSYSSMDIERPSPHMDIPEEERKPTPGQADMFMRSTLSQSTRRNRRLNYLLRYLAPPDATESIAAAAASASAAHNRSRARSTGSGVGTVHTGDDAHQQHHHPTLANILSISGSMSNLSFSESTYFSDAEMEARAPELYRQYIGRFMDNDDDNNDDDDGSKDDDMENGRGTGAEDADDEQDDERDGETRRAISQPTPFGKDIGLVDRILWHVDHPTQSQRNRELELQSQEQAESQQKQHSMASVMASTSVYTRRQIEEEEEFEEEFDTESEAEDSNMALEESDDRKGPLKDTDDDDVLVSISVTPPIPPDPVPGVISSALASAAISLEQPEERARFAEVENGDDLDSDDGKELDPAVAERKEDQEALRREFVLLMKQRFLDGLDRNFDYSMVDFNEDLDDLEQESHDKEDRWFDEEDEDEDARGVNLGSSSARRTSLVADSELRTRMTYDERVRVWENSAQNGSGGYDY
ncbi:hypothetical protein BG011_006001 [Mortierella polycephala]|uniref:CCD97-like C-terminal domain-containing protein n=1 Tax=Mortierella polycephala TaxID=41804 RepID=A0A9P6PU20_9FUNG|nr:hypothetical protein BG011_006001 [Mortierella polycephala]